MPAVHFEFVRQRRLRVWWIAAGLGLVVLLLAGFDARQALEQQRLATQQEDAAQHRLQRLKLRRLRIFVPAVSTSPNQEKQARALAPVVMNLNAPWPNWLVALRASTGNNIALLKLTLSTENASVSVDGEAKSLDDITVFTRQLSTNPLVASVALLEHHLLESVPGSPVAFKAVVVFKGAGSADQP